MKLRELFDKLTLGMLDTDVMVKLERVYQSHQGAWPNPKTIKSTTLRELKAVEIQDDGSVTLVVDE